MNTQQDLIPNATIPRSDFLTDTDLLRLWQYTSELSTTDPLTALINAIAWLDPVSVHTYFGDYTIGEILEQYYPTQGYDDPTMIGLLIAQQVFPEIYSQAIIKLRREDSFVDIGAYIMHQIEADYGIPLSAYDEHEAYLYGIVPPKWGADPLDADWLNTHKNTKLIRAIYDHIGMEIEDHFDTQFRIYNNTYQAETTIGYVIKSIYKEIPSFRDTLYEYLAFALAYLVQSTGILPLDLAYTYEDECQFADPWDPIAARDMQDLTNQATAMLNKIDIAFDKIEASPLLHNALITNIKLANKYIRTRLKSRKGNSTDGIEHYEPSDCRLQWPDINTSAE